jgi:predicted aspartyl protease
MEAVPPTQWQTRRLEAARRPELDHAWYEQATARVAPQVEGDAGVVRLRRIFGKYFLFARVDGKRVRFMVDWGANPVVVMPPKTAASVGLPTGRPVEATDVGLGTASYTIGMAGTLAIGPSTLREVPVIVQPVNLRLRVGALRVTPKYGLIGTGLLAGYGRFALDLASRELLLGSWPRSLDRPLVNVPVRLDNGQILLEGLLDGAPVDLLVDVGGDAGQVSFHGARAREFMAARQNACSDAHERTAGPQFLRVESFVLGSVELGPITVFVNPDAPLDSASIGHGLFAEGAVGVDLWDGRLAALRGS